MSLPATYPRGYYPVGTIVSLDPAQTQPITTSKTVSGLTATSTASYVAVPNSQLQASFNQVVSYYMTVVTNNLNFQIYGSVDGVNFNAIASTITTINAAASGLVTLATGGYLFYQLYVEDASGGSHGTCTGAGFCI